MTKARELADLAGSSGGGIDVEAERLNQVIQSIEGAEGFDWSAGMALQVVETVPDDSAGEVGDVVFVLSDPKVVEPGLPGLGGWADVTAVTGDSGNRYTYKADGMDWVAYEWTGDGSVTTTAGLVDALVMGGGGQGSGGWISPGAYATEGVEELTADAHAVKIGAAATADNQNGGSSYIGNGAVKLIYASGGAGSAGPDTGPGQSAYGSLESSITGTKRYFCAYGDSWADLTYKEPGQGGHYDHGGAQQPGGVIVRVPAANALATIPNTWGDL